MAKVTVYYFETFDIKTGEMVKSKRMATLEYIKRINGSSTPIMDTATTVDSSKIDENGRYPKFSS